MRYPRRADVEQLIAAIESYFAGGPMPENIAEAIRILRGDR